MDAFNPPRRLVILVPGYQQQLKVGQTVTRLKSHVEESLNGASLPIARAGYEGYAITIDGVTTDVFEVPWQTFVSPLSSMGWVAKMTAGLRMTASWLKPSIISRPANATWAFWFAFGTLLMLLWWLSTLAALLLSIPIPSISLGPIHLHQIGSTLQHWSGLVVTTAVLGMFNVNVDASIDVADMFRRFVDRLKDNEGLTFTLLVRNAVRDCVNAVDDQQYSERCVVGHSFGVLVAIDYVVNVPLSAKYTLITFGGFLQLICAERPGVIGWLNACASSTGLVKWLDFWSTDDHFSSSMPDGVAGDKLTSLPINNRATWFERITPIAHAMYYSNPDVLQSIFLPSVLAAGSGDSVTEESWRTHGRLGTG